MFPFQGPVSGLIRECIDHLSMNRLDTTQYAMPAQDTRVAHRMIWATSGITTAMLLAILVMGMSDAHNPTDGIFSTLAILPFGLVALDLWTLLVGFLRRHAVTPLRIPLKTPAILAALHTGAGFIAAHLARFDSLYELVWIDERVGHYEVRLGAAAGVLLLTAVALILTVFELRLVRWVLISEVTAAGPGPEIPRNEVEDVELGAEHIYEAQVLLNNLGYEVKPISGELNEATIESITTFQTGAGLQPTGTLTAKTMIDLRNQFREKEGESSPVMAVSEHAVKRTSSRIASFFKRS